MDFDTLDKQMRSFEQSLDRCMLQGAYVVARLDGHGFTRLTKKNGILRNLSMCDSVTT
jgi:tRNA(His) guanylyltransferase